MADRDYYAILGVPRTAAKDEIKKAYRKMARKFHPDLHPGDKSAEQKFKEVSQAYEALSDDGKRKLYDQFGEAGLKGGFAGGRPEGGPTYQRGPGGYTYYSDSADNPFENFDFSQFRGTGGAESVNDLLGRMFGGGGGRRRGARGGFGVGEEEVAGPVPGTDVESDLRLTFEQAARGAATEMRLRHASGKYETLTVKIPPGVTEGQRIRLKGRGQPSPNGGPPGDLYVVCRVAEHAYFRREGRDVYIDLPISPGEAAAGASVDLPTIQGLRTVTVPPGTSSGQKLRLREAGLPAGPRGEPAGDQYAVIKIVLPKSIDRESAELLRQFDQRTSFNPRRDLKW